jgi:hypothetical protein
MIKFSQIAVKLNGERIATLGNPRRSGFFPNQRGVLQRTISGIKFAARVNGRIKPLGVGLLCYSDQDTQENSTEAELVRSERWKPYDVGKLWAFVNNQIINLAQIDPTGQRMLKSGFVTEEGQFIIDLKE